MCWGGGGGVCVGEQHQQYVAIAYSAGAQPCWLSDWVISGTASCCPAALIIHPLQMKCIAQHRLTKHVLPSCQPRLKLLQVVLPSEGLERIAVVNPGRHGAQHKGEATREAAGVVLPAAREAAAVGSSTVSDSSQALCDASNDGQATMHRLDRHPAPKNTANRCVFHPIPMLIPT